MRKSAASRLAKQDHDTSNSEARGYFHDRVVLVTGASSGIGRDVALRLSEMGAKVALVGLTEALRVELFRSGVKASLVMPGAIDTQLGRAKSGDEPPSGWRRR
jgi:NAD(P)-dependent dehydrogenase (short-subunit alcohol dehydrogenase family)